MRIPHLVLIPSALLLLSTGCTAVYTIDDVITESAAITDDRLIGEWFEPTSGDRAFVTRGANRDYQVTYIDKEDSAVMRGRLGRLGTTLVLDLYPDMKEWARRKESGLPFHLFAGIQFSGDSLTVRAVNGDSLQTTLKAGEIRLPYSRIDGNVVLHGDASGVRRSLEKLYRRRRGLDEPTVYRRRTP